MKSNREGGQVRLGSVLLILSLAAAVLYPSRSAHASGIEIGSSGTATINFAVYNTTPGITPSTGTPIFSSDGMLMDAGSSALPVLTTVNGTEQTFSQTNLGGYTNNIFTANLPPPSSFGMATFSTSASTALNNNGTSTNQQGVSFNSATLATPGMPAMPGTFLQSAPPSTPPTSGVASVSFASLHADFTNPSNVFPPTSFTGAPGVAISATGNLGSAPGSFVELADKGAVTINDGKGNITTDPYTIVVGLTFNSTLTHNTYTYTNLPTGSSGTTPTIDPPDAMTNAFSISFNPNFPSVTISPGGTFSVDSSLTLVSDPESLIKLADLSGTPGLPDFGAFVGGPAPAAVPEPSSLVQVGTVLFLVAGLWVWRSLGRNRRAARGLSRSRPGLAALVVLFFGLLAPGLAPAGTDHRE